MLGMVTGIRRVLGFLTAALLLSGSVDPLSGTGRFVCGADDFTVPALTADEQRVLQTIESGDVLATVSFLAADELAGRDTPSKELEIAGAYVASRFRGAGLEGLGAEGSFYQVQEMPRWFAPDGVVSLVTAASPQGLVGCVPVGGGDQAVELRGAVITDGAGSELRGAIVVVDEPPLPPAAAENPAVAGLSVARRVAPLAARGAAAVLIRAAEGGVLSAAVQRLRAESVALPQQLSLPVVLIPADADLGGEVQLTVPPRRRVSEQVRNVAGVLRGSDPRLSAEAIVITAHLDHIGRAAGDRQGDVIFNGADDNATGVTAVVTLAEAFGRLQPRPARSVVFITFWGEEKGLLGSKAWCEQPLWPLEKTVANINIEMIGRPEEGATEKMWGTGWTRSSLGPQLAAGAKRAGVEVFHREDVSEMLYARSDNYSFVQKGVIAHSFSAGSLHQDYHQLTDEYTRLNIPHMTRIIQGLFAGSLPLARAELTPTKSAAAKSAR